MRSLLARISWVAAVAAASLVGCSTSSDPCGGCSGATICDGATKACVPAIAEGQPCGSATLDGGAASDAGLQCAEGTSCTALGLDAQGGPLVCAHTCDPSGLGPSCPNGGTCGVSSDSATVGECLDVVAPGQPCDSNGIAQCAAPAECIVSAAGATSGVCFDICDPTQANPGCGSGTSCLSVFDAPDAGLCATPVSAGDPCSNTAEAFCPVDSVCLQTTDQDAGACVPRCDPMDSASCPELQSCLDLGSTGFCAQAQALGQPCAFDQALYCGNDALCLTTSVDAGEGTCRQNCSDGGVCPPGYTCEATTDPSVLFCE